MKTEYVVKKLETARRYAQENPAAYERNVKALEAVQPTPIPASDIYVNIGASWVDSAYYCDFLGEKLGICCLIRRGKNYFSKKEQASVFT